jgi:hypothetical protein
VTVYVPDLHEMSPIVVGTLEIGGSDTLCAEIHEMSPIVEGTLKIGRSDSLCARFT